MDNKLTWALEAVGTERGRSVLFLRDSEGRLYVVPTDLVSMSLLAGRGAAIRNDAVPKERDL